MGRRELQQRFEARADVDDGSAPPATRALFARHHPPFDTVVGFESNAPRFGTSAYYANNVAGANTSAHYAHAVRGRDGVGADGTLGGKQNKGDKQNKGGGGARATSSFAATGVRGGELFASPKPLWVGKYTRERSVRVQSAAARASSKEKLGVVLATRSEIAAKKAAAKKALKVAALKAAVLSARADEARAKARERQRVDRQFRQALARSQGSASPRASPHAAAADEAAAEKRADQAAQAKALKAKQKHSNGWSSESASGYDPTKMMNYAQKKGRGGAAPQQHGSLSGGGVWVCRHSALPPRVQFAPALI